MPIGRFITKVINMKPLLFIGLMLFSFLLISSCGKHSNVDIPESLKGFATYSMTEYSYEYNDRGLDSVKHRIFFTLEKGEYVLGYGTDTFYEYNDKDSVLLERSFFIDSLGLVDVKHYEYGKFGRTATHTLSDENDTSSYEIFEYDTEGRIISETSYYKSYAIPGEQEDLALIDLRISELSYNDAGKVDEERHWSNQDSSWNSIKYDYRSDGLPYRRVQKNLDNPYVETIFYYEYSLSKTDVHEYEKSPTGEVISHSRKFYYPGTDQLHRFITFLDGEPYLIIYYNEQGQVTAEEFFQFGEKLMRTEYTYSEGKLIKEILGENQLHYAF